MDWTDHPQLPTLTSALRPRAYSDRIAAAKARYDLKSVAADEPASGIEVQSVEPNSAAAGLGIHVGDVLCEWNGQPIASDADWITTRNTATGKVGVWSKGGKLRHVDLPNGLIGISFDPYLRPEVLYLRELPKDESPDAELFAGVSTLSDDPALAASAVAAAQSRGEKSISLFVIAAHVAIERADFLQAIACGIWAIRNGSPLDKKIAAVIVHAACLASFHLKLAATIEAAYPEIKVNEWPPDYADVETATNAQDELDACKKIAWATASDCPQAFDDRHPTDVTDKIANDAAGKTGSRMAAESIRKSGSFSFQVPPAATKPNWGTDVRPAAPNERFTAKIQLAGNGKKDLKTGIRQMVRFGVCYEHSSGMPLSITVSLDGRIDIEGKLLPEVEFRLADRIHPGKPFSVQMTIVDHRCAVDVAGLRVFDGPMFDEEKERNLSLVVATTGVKCDLRHVQWETAPAK